MSRSSRDYQGGAPGHFWPKLAGWFIVPAAASIATRLLAPLVVKATDTPEKQTEMLMTLSGVAHALGAAGSWYVSGHMFNDSVGTQAFFRGGMWSEMVSALFIPASIVATSQLSKAAAANPALSAPTVKGMDPKTNIEGMLALLTGGVSKKMAQPKFYNQLSR